MESAIFEIFFPFLCEEMCRLHSKNADFSLISAVFMLILCRVFRLEPFAGCTLYLILKNQVLGWTSCNSITYFIPVVGKSSLQSITQTFGIIGTAIDPEPKLIDL